MLPHQRRSPVTTRSVVDSSAAHATRMCIAAAGAGLAALSMSALLFTALTPWNGLLGFVFVAYVFFLAIYGFLVSFDERGPAVRDRLAGAVIHSMAFLLLTALVVVVGYTFWRGAAAIIHINFFTEDLSTAGGADPLTSGGVLNAIVGTLQQIAIALLVTVPLGLTCAVFMSEVPGKFARFTRTVVEAMTALPSIVAGLFIYATLIVIFGVEKSGFAAAMALSIMMMPIIIRAADVVLRLVPGTLREASYALGSPRWRTVLTVVLPTAKSGLTTAVILGTARGIGETSPVLLTSGYTQFMQTSPFGQPQTSLPLAAFTLVGAPESVMITRGFGAAAVLMILVLILFVLARTFGGRGPGELTARQQRRRAAQSRRDLARYVERTFAGVQPPGTSKTPVQRKAD